MVSLPVDPHDIATKKQILCQEMPSSEGGVSGMLVRHGSAFGILYATHIANEGFQRFSISHELGHYFLEGHPEAVFKNGAYHESRAGYVSNDKYEIEADQFASGLLMPNFLFDPALDKAGNGMEAIKSLSKLCGTSLTSTAIRYAQRTPEPAAIVVSIGDVVDYCFMSDELKEYPEITWLKKGARVPRNTKTFDFNRDDNNVRYSSESEGSVDIVSWFGGRIDGELYEEVIGLGEYGKTLTVLTGADLPDVEEIEEEHELEESWTPRFRR
ncbi:MAG: ImmA/IrrE family metallo-endopeptidase [Candidatus Thiodiazotropha weberae]|nr:ImmA/IrrE family metallo-endopeptidase [Candidatus Thiodiazotropha lotti]MCG8010104.1 ImmA/IrrE family metallo-endopeptidase [Candidatus Thiodiazotropha lotti]MCW4209562.1 ImmA/IrrE family metallo-endopeptidase [Candidatus Thiodiazotropha lotti]MCW4216745.1 ImmA/IrrE family metallo-endopeptidase [Candidatus Thiodiazotropha lotti]